MSPFFLLCQFDTSPGRSLNSALLYYAEQDPLEASGVVDVFDHIYEKTVGSRQGVEARVLKPLLRQVYICATAPSQTQEALRLALVRLLSFLCSQDGKTSAYYNAVDQFFEDYDRVWRPSTGHLPSVFVSLFDDFTFIHGALDEPEFHITPQQILEKVNGHRNDADDQKSRGDG